MSDDEGGKETAHFVSRLTRPAEFDLADALDFLQRSSGGVEAAHRFNDRLDAVLEALCTSIATEIAERGRYGGRSDEAASVYFARPIYRAEIQTTKTSARRSSAGLWYVFYSIEDMDRDSRPDALIVYAIQHSAAAPFAVDTERLENEGGEKDD